MAIDLQRQKAAKLKEEFNIPICAAARKWEHAIFIQENILPLYDGGSCQCNTVSQALETNPDSLLTDSDSTHPHRPFSRRRTYSARAS